MEIAVNVGISAKKFEEEFGPVVDAVRAGKTGDGSISLEVYGEPNGPNEPSITKVSFSNDDMERDEIRERVMFDWDEL